MSAAGRVSRPQGGIADTALLPDAASQVPGAYELPFAAKKAICKLPSVRAVVCVGVLVKGDTMHFEYISAAVTQGITRVGLDTDVPVIFGVLTCLTEEQARMRAGVGTGDGEPAPVLAPALPARMSRRHRSSLPHHPRSRPRPQPRRGLGQVCRAHGSARVDDVTAESLHPTFLLRRQASTHHAIGP